nr:unnamed protein product [Callosobruchus chinensis]
MATTVLEKVIARQTKLGENRINNAFIDKDRCSKIMDKIADIKLRKLGRDEFENGITKMTQLNFEQVQQQSHVKIYYVNVNGREIPAVYDLLCELFLHADAEKASKSFQETTEVYYSKVLSKLGVSEDEFLAQVKLFLPCAKLERLNQCTPEDVQRAALEVEECILYPELSREQCYVVLRNLYKSSEASLIQFDLTSAQDLPGNLGEYFKVKLVASQRGTVQTHHLFAKLAYTQFPGELSVSSIAFKKERLFFEGIIKGVEDLGLDKLTDFCPKCYFASNNMLLFDDVSISGYHSGDFNVPVSYKWLATTVKMLAKLHATSIIFEEKLSKKHGRTVRIDTEYPDAVLESIFRDSEDKRGAEQDMTCSICDFISSEADHYQSSLNQNSLIERVKAICANIHKHVTKSDKIRNVLSHGDLWGANIMYKEDDDSGAASAYFIDFQMIRYVPPSLDLMFLIFVNADRTTRLEHLTDMIKLYHQELTQILSSYSIDISRAFSLDELVESCEEVKAIVICMSLMYSRFHSLSKEQRQELLSHKKRPEKNMEKTSPQGPLIIRSRGLLQDLLHMFENKTTMSVLDKVIANHSTLCNIALDDSFIEKNKFDCIVDRIPGIKLRKLSEDEFKSGIIKLLEFDPDKIQHETYGNVFYVEKETVKVPAVYDLLCEVLLNIDSKVLSKSFHTIIEEYYKKVLLKYQVTNDQFRAQVRLFLPCAKLNKLYNLRSKGNIDEIIETVWEVEECILYPVLLREEVYHIVNSIYKTYQTELVSFEVELAKDLPGNLGTYFKIKITVEDSTQIQSHHLFAKMIDENKEKIVVDFTKFPFRKERFFFETMLDHLKELGVEKLTDFCPKCYFTRQGMLIFEDISVDGYSSWNYQEPVTHNWLDTAIKLLAKLHATSIIFEEKLGDRLGRTVRLDEEYPDDVREAAFIAKEEYQDYQNCNNSSVYRYLLSKFPELPKRIHINDLRQKVKIACERMYEVIKKSRKIRNVLNHGDMWGGNIMYREDKTTGVSSAYLIDFQLIRYCPPSLDLMFLLYTNTDRATRVKHLKELISLYYKEMTCILGSYDIDIGGIFTFDQLTESCKNVAPSIICLSLMYGELGLMPEQQRKEMKDDKEREQRFAKVDKTPELENAWDYEPFKIRIGGLIIANHSTLCNVALDDSFVEKNKYECIVDSIPNIKLKKLSEDEFKNGILKLLQFDTDKVQHDTCGNVFYVERETVKVPAVYDLLCEVFLGMDPKVLLQSFNGITEEYYNQLLSKYEITKDQFRAQVRLFLPYAKLKKLYSLCNKGNIDEITETVWEVEECILYPELLREEVYHIVKSIYKSNHAELVSFDVELAKDLPGNLGKYFKIKITAEDSTGAQSHHLFAKMIDEGKEKMIADFSRFPFKKEQFFFETIRDRLKELGMEKLTDFCPKCYFTRKDMLIFEDISVNGYSSWDYQVPVSYNWLAATIKLLAKLHATSIILEEKLGDKLGRTIRLDEEYPDDVREAAFIAKEEYKDYQDCNRRFMYGYLLSKFPEVPKKIHKDKLKEKVKVAFDQIYEVVKKSGKIRNVLSHGDMWGANIMYKEDKNIGASSAYLIDFQLIRYCPPSLDLMFLLYTNTDRATRVKRLQELIRLYYSELGHILDLHGIHVENIFTFEQLIESCKEVEPSIICISLMYGAFLLMPEQQRKDIQNDKERDDQFSKVDKGPEIEKLWNYEPFKIRIEGLVEDIIRIYDDDAVCVNMSLSGEFLRKHSALYDSTLDDGFIDKSKVWYIVNTLPRGVVRSIDEFSDGMNNLMELDTSGIEEQEFGKFLYIKANSVKVPAVFELLCEIYNDRDNGARLKSFRNITEDYYNKVISSHGVTKDEFRKQVKLFLPFAKLERLYQLCRQERVADIKNAALEVEECLLNPELDREECVLILSNIYQSDEAVLISYDVVPAQGLPGNLGQYFKVRLIARIGKETETHHLFAKLMHVGNTELTQFSLLPYRKERFFFESLLERCKEVGMEKLTDFCPKCYFASDSMLIFEDVSVKGYSSWNYHIPVSYKWLTVAVRMLAKLHATSIILEERLSKSMGRAVRLDEEYPDGVYEAGPHDEEKYKPLQDACRVCISEYFLSKFPDVPKKLHMGVLKEKINSACGEMNKIILKSDKMRNVLNHGDMWAANIMYKEDNHAGISSAYLIDFQMIRYCPPSVDLMTLLYVSTDRATRLKHMRTLIELYYEELTQICSCYDINVECIFKLEELVESCKEIEPAIICKALTYCQILLMPEPFRKRLLSDKERSNQYYIGDRSRELEKVILCHNCMRYGHLGKHCKSNPRCSKCHEGHLTSNCVSSFDIPKCLNCDEDHYAYEIKKCKEFERQKEIKSRMACSNLSYIDAEKSIPRVSYSSITQKNINNPLSQNNVVINRPSTSLTQQSSSNSLQLNRQTYSSSYSVRKRPRNNNSLDISDPTEQLRKNIISNPSLPSESGGITNKSTYLNNLQKPVDESLLNTVIELFFKFHSILCHSSVDGSFIDKSKYQFIEGRVPYFKLRKLSESNFKNGIMHFMKFDIGKIEKESCGRIFYVEANTSKTPAVYELLCEIFCRSDNEARLRLFHDITEDYFNKAMSNRGLTKNQFRMQVRLFLPYAKLEKLYKICKQGSVADIEQAALDVEDCLLYPDLYKEECSVIVRNIYQSHEAILLSFNIVPAQDTPGYLGKYYKIQLVAENGTEIQTHHLFAKAIDRDNIEITEFSLLAFRKEQFFFESMLENCRTSGIEKLFDFCPKCYFTRDDMLVFEDVSANGYNSWNFHTPASYKFLTTTVRMLAKLHAASIIFEERLSEKLGRPARLDEEYPNELREVVGQDKRKLKAFLNSYRRCICEYLLSKFSDVPKKMQMSALRKRISNACNRIYEIVQKSDKMRNVLNHGDMWGANIMYKEDKVTGIASGYLIDFQMIRYCPPSVDLMFLLYANTDRVTRLKHLQGLIEIYYEELAQICCLYDISIEGIFNFDQLVTSCREVEPAIICTALMYGQLLLMPDPFRKEMLSDEERSKQFFVGDRSCELEKVWYYEPLRSRIRGLVEDIIRIYEDET